MSSLKTNALAFAVIQAAEYLVPLLAIPYLIRTLGASGFGQIAFAQAVCVFFAILVDYGFNLSASRMASVYRSDKQKLSEMFWSVQSTKLLLLIISATILFILTEVVGKLKPLQWVLFICLLPAVGSVTYPLWLFQGLELVRKTAPLVLASRLISLGLMLLLVNSEKDVNLAAFLLTAATPLAGMATWFLIRKHGLVGWKRPNLADLFEKLKEGRHAFIASAASSLYRSTNAMVLGFTSGSLAVAYYSVCEKLVRVSQECSKPVAQATYPRVSYLAEHDPAAARVLLMKTLWVIGGIGLLSSCALFFLAPLILKVVGGENLTGALSTLHAMSAVPLIGSLNLVLGVQTMHPFGHARKFSRLVLCSGAFNSALIFPATIYYGAFGAATVYLLSEILLLINLVRFNLKLRSSAIIGYK